MTNCINGVYVNVDKLTKAIASGTVVDLGSSHITSTEARDMAFNMLMGAKHCVESEGDVIKMHCADCPEIEDQENRYGVLENSLRDISDKLREAQRKCDWDAVEGVVGTINSLV